MNKVNCEKCEHNKVCKFKFKLGEISKEYENFISGVNVYPFQISLNCKEFKEVKSMPRGTFHIEPTPYYGTGTLYLDYETYTTDNTKEG